ncbi:MAG: hypothetical protein ACI85K_003022 [Hyphomicrobiaceae bacterium]
MTEEPRWWRWLAILALAVGVALRAWPWLSEPLLVFEDGSVFFAPNYAQFEWGGFVAPYAGYVPFGANLSALLLCRLPTECIPTAFVAGAAAVHLAAGCALLSRPWLAVAPFWARVLLAAVIVLLPISSYLEFTTLAYMQWPMLCWLFLLLVEPVHPGVSSTWLRRCVSVALLVLLTLSHPLAIVLAPLALLRSVRDAQQLRWFAYAAALAGYWLVHLLLIGEHGAPESAMSLIRAFDCIPALLVRVGLESMVGFDGWQWLSAYGAVVVFSVAILCWLVAAALVTLAARRWQAATRTFAIACGWLMVVPLATSLLARDVAWDDQWIIRYIWLSRVGFLLVLTLCVTTLLSRWLVAGGAVLLAFALSHSNSGCHGHASGADDLRQFVGKLQAKELRDGHRRLIDERFHRGKQSPILIRPH